MKQFFLFVFFTLMSTSLYAQLGIGTTTPKAFFNVAEGKDVLFGADVSGAGNKLIWNPTQGAFRAGNVNTNNWDPALLGFYSFATGFNTLANGYISTALGFTTSANGAYTTALGYYTTATGGNAMALGNYTTASGYYSTAMGNNVSTDGKSGSFIIGDASTSTNYLNTANNQMIMRFLGGYVLYTSAPTNQGAAVGVRLAAGGNAWLTISDSTRKENFRLADGASFLHKISTLRLGSWNYKGQDVKQYRHYGPMAQDFFACFGHDALGTIGEDKSINQADFEGVNLIAIQALLKKVERLETENTELKADNRILRSESATMKDQTASIKSDLEQIKKQLASLPKQ